MTLADERIAQYLESIDTTDQNDDEKLEAPMDALDEVAALKFRAAEVRAMLRRRERRSSRSLIRKAVR